MGGPTSAGEALDEDLARAAPPALSSARRRLERRRPRERRESRRPFFLGEAHQQGKGKQEQKAQYGPACEKGQPYSFF